MSNAAIAVFRVRAGQREFERGVDLHRISGLLARRQYGKTTIGGRIALKKMMRTPGHTVIFGSVKIDLGREIVRKESEAMRKAFEVLGSMAAQGNTLLDVVDPQKGKSVSAVNLDDWAELYEASRLEFRLYHSKTIYSRTKVVALTPSAVGETGDLILDEVGRVKNFRDVVEAVTPIIASNPSFRCIYTTTPPPDDTHYSFDLLAPPVGVDLPVSPTGNWYQSELGVWVLRITAEDAYADGVPLYDDDTGQAISPEEARAKSHDKDAWDRNYGCRFVIGGTSACGLLQLDTAQRRGIGSCQHISVQSDSDMAAALHWLAAHLNSGPIGLGWDTATTTKETSNPSAVTVLEQDGSQFSAVAIITWKTADPDIATERMDAIIRAIAARPEGGRARRLCIDATNERYFSQSMRKEFGAMIPVELVVGSESIQQPGQQEAMTTKQFLGAQLVGELDDNHLTLPPERYIREDWRLVRKEKGAFICEPDANGRHGDTFDSTKLALRALRSNAGGLTTAEGIRVGGNNAMRGMRPTFQPRRLTCA